MVLDIFLIIVVVNEAETDLHQNQSSVLYRRERKL